MACVPAGRVLMPTRCSTLLAASVTAIGGQDTVSDCDKVAAPREPHGRPRQAKRDEKVRNCLPHPASGMSQKHARSAYACQRPHLLICQTWAATSIPSGLSQLVSQMISRTQALRRLPAPLAGINLQFGLTNHISGQVKTFSTEGGRTEMRAVTGPDNGHQSFAGRHRLRPPR